MTRELVLLYWQIGRDILERQAREGLGVKVIERLAHDLRTAFPDMKGFSPRNLKYMRSFAQAWPEAQFVQQAAAQLPWFHLCTLIDKLKMREVRDWYLSAADQHNWSCNVLEMQIETSLLGDKTHPMGILSCANSAHEMCNSFDRNGRFWIDVSASEVQAVDAAMQIT